MFLKTLTKHLYPARLLIKTSLTNTIKYERTEIFPYLLPEQQRWATKKAGGTVKNTKDSHPKYLGVKKFGGEWCIPGNIIMRQRGTKFHPGEYVGLGKDHTIYALVEGQVKFSKDYIHGRRRKIRQYISVVPGTKPPKAHRNFPPWFGCQMRRRRREKELELMKKIKKVDIKLENVSECSDGTSEIGTLITYFKKK